jgi:Heterokaryon incompatibility protein (HET)
LTKELLMEVEVAKPMIPYTYRKLETTNYFRLLSVKTRDESAGSKDGLCSFNLESFDRRKCPKYETVSYTWGDPFILTVVSIHLDCEASLIVNSSVLTALARLAANCLTGYLWIDQICLYTNRYRTKCLRNLRFWPQFCERFGFVSEWKNLCSVLSKKFMA